MLKRLKTVSLLSLMVAALVVGLGFAVTQNFGINQASAAEVEPQKSTFTHTVMPMVLDCVNMSEEVRAYADERGYCDGNTPLIDKGIISIATTPVTVIGSCGSATINQMNGPNPGQAQWGLGVQSSLGPLIRVNWWINWTNWSVGFGGNEAGTWGGFSTSFGTNHFGTTAPGWVTSSLGGTVTLAWGGTCQILNPTDGGQIT